MKMNKKTTMLLSAAVLTTAMVVTPAVTHVGVAHADNISALSSGFNFTWSGLPCSYDFRTRTLTLAGGVMNQDTGFGIEELGYGDDQLVVENLIISGPVQLKGNMSRLFSSSNLKTILGLNNLDTSEVTDMSRMFYNDSLVTSLDVSKFDTSNVTNMSSMFYGTKSVKNLDVSNFDTSKVTDMNNMFNGVSSVTSLDVSKFDTSNVTNMSSMFYGTKSVKNLDVSNFDTSKVTKMTNMFSDASSVTSLDVSNFDTSNVTDMGYMFSGVSSVTSLDVSKFDTSNVTDMGGMFYGTNSVKNLDVSNFGTSNVTNMRYMFSDASSVTSLDVSKFDTSNVTDMGYMFSSVNSVTSLDVSKFDTSKVTDMSYMFNNDQGLTSLDLTNFDMNNASGKLTGMFSGDSKLSKLDLGSNVKFDTEAGLPEPSSDVTTGKWQNVGTGTVDNPNGKVVWTSAQLMSTYTGSGADTYVWQRKAGANVTVKYVDEQGKSIASDVTLSGKMGNAYTTIQKTISGYTFSKVQGNAKGTFTGEAQTVTYVYKKNSTPTPPTPSVKYQAVYRLYNKNTGEHFYTESAFERDSLVKGGWNNEGTGWSAPTTGSAVYRVYNPNAKGGDHYYTASQYEAQSLVKGGWKWDNGGKPVFYSGGKTKIYVAFNPNATASGSHNYTSSAYEQQSLLNGGWKYGSVQFYGK